MLRENQPGMTEVDAGPPSGGDGRAPVRVVHADDPVAAALELVDVHGADVADDLTGAERQVRLRVEAGRRALVPSGADDVELLARAEEVREAAAAPPAIGDDDVAELGRLAAELARAARIRARTEARFTENLQARLAASAGVALHPGAIKDAGEAVVVAEAALAAAEQALVDLGPRPEPGSDPAPLAPTPQPEDATRREPDGADGHHGPGDDPVLRAPHDVFDEAALDRSRATTRGAAVFLVLLGLGVIAMAIQLPIAVTIGLAAAGVVLGVAIAVKGRHVADEDADDRANSASMLDNLPNVTGKTTLEPAGDEPEPEPEPGPDPEPGPGEDDDPWLDRRVALDATRDEAEEEVRATRRRWHQLAGADADPYDIDAVIRVHDPQLAFDARVADASPTVRTVAAFHRKAQARWRVLWNAIGHDDPPEPEELDAVLDDLLGEHRRRQAELRRLEAAEERAAAAVEARTPLVLVEPSAWVSSGRLAQLLASVPPQGEVFVVERESSGELS